MNGYDVVSRVPQVVLIGSTVIGSWLGMQGVHELGHVFGAGLSGGQVARVVLHPLTISRTDSMENPHPLVVVWAGPVVGVAAPLVLWIAAAGAASATRAALRHCFVIVGIAGLLGGRGLADERRQPAAEPFPPSGNAVIRGTAGSSEIVIRTTDRLAGAIHSLEWNGKEFIDSHDHGRQLQSAASFDCASGKEFWAECFNPTEAGSRRDGVGATSSSKLLLLQAGGSRLRTTTQMTFWLSPGEKSSGRPALNDTILSDHRVSKQVRIGYQTLAHVVDYAVTFSVPAGEHHTYAQFEALTGYMPAEFGLFWKFLPASGTLQELDDGPGEQQWPVVFATEGGSHAMGVYSPDQPSPGYEKAGYGRFRFQAEKVVKWNCVFRVRSAKGIAPGEYHFRVFVAVGTLEDVRQALDALVREFAE